MGGREGGREKEEEGGGKEGAREGGGRSDEGR